MAKKYFKQTSYIRVFKKKNSSIFDIALTFETNPVVSYTMYTHIGQAIPLQFCSGIFEE